MVSHLARLRKKKHPNGIQLKFSIRKRYKSFTTAPARRTGSRSQQKWKPKKGLLKKMKDAFFPCFSHTKATENASSRGWGGGRELGCRLDEDLQTIINLRRSPQTRLAILHEVDSAAWKKMKPCSLDVLEAFASYGLAPEFAQYAIYDPTLRIATSIDAIATRFNPRRLIDGAENPVAASAYKDDNAICLIETKVGYRGDNLTASCGMLDGPLSDQVDSHLNQFWLQLIIPWMILEKHYKVKVHNAYLVIANNNGAQLINLKLTAPWAYERREEIYRYFVDVQKFGAVTARARVEAPPF